IRRVGQHPNGRSEMMKNVVISLAIGVGALLSSGANAAPLSVSPSMLPDYGGSYNYVPRERYIERRGYYDGGYYDNGPSVGIGVGPGGVGVGFGVGPRW